MYSTFGAQFAAPSGTRELMDDLGELARGDAGLINLGGGNPSRIPALEEVFREAWQAVPVDDWLRLGAVYDAPQGYQPLRVALAEMLATRCGWPVTEQNLLVTTGSQASFFSVFNLLGGAGPAGFRRVLLPQAPEYIGYTQSAIDPRTFLSYPARIELLPGQRFRYRPDFDAIGQASGLAAICVSRPCNPTGNVISDEDLAALRALAGERGVPLLVDCAYGEPVPGISFVPSALTWAPDLVMFLSFSKLGLPGLRTGLVVARPELIDVLASLNAMLTLAPTAVGARLLVEVMKRHDLLDLAASAVRPHYAAHSRLAQVLADEALAGLDYRIHVSEGAIFLWLWFPALRAPVQRLYANLKSRGVLVIPGHHFGPGLETSWTHLTQCVRISYAQPEPVLRRGLSILAEEVRALH